MNLINEVSGLSYIIIFKIMIWNQYILTMTLCKDYEMKSKINSKHMT